MPPKRNKHNDGDKKDGDHKKDGDKKKTPKTMKDPAEGFDMTKRATRDVRLSILPLLNALRQTRMQTQNEYADQMQRTRGIFGQEIQGLKPLAGQYSAASGQMINGLSNALQAFGGGGGGGFAGENAAATDAANAAARGGLGMLGMTQQNALGTLKAATGAASMQRGEALQNVAGQRMDALDLLRQQGLDIRNQMPALIRQRMDELQQGAFERSLALRQFLLNKKSTLAEIASNDALSQLLQNNLSDILGGGFTNTGGTNGGGGGIPGDNTAGGGPGNPGPQGHPIPGSGGDQPGGGAGPQPTAFQQFVGGQQGWQGLTNQQQENVRNKIHEYFLHHQQDPAFNQPNWDTTQNGGHTPFDLINALRNFYYRQHDHKNPI